MKTFMDDQAGYNDFSMKISHNFFADLEIFLQTLKCKKWLDENSYIYGLFNSIFKSCKYKSIAKQLNTKIELSDGFKKIADGRIKYEIYLTKFGTYGSYKLPNKIYLNVLRNSIDETFHTLLHEMIHLKVEGEVIKKNLSHKEKEALVENLEKEFVE